MPKVDPEPEIVIDTTNDYLLSAGQNLPNHTTSLQGLGKFVRQALPTVPIFRTKQDAFRYAAWLVELADGHLPDSQDEESLTFEMIRNAIRNT